MAPRRSQRAPAGRPRIDPTTETATLSDDRRSQVRRAQHKYRQKKEAIFLNATARADQLEARIHAARKEAAELCASAEQTRLRMSHPEIYARLETLHEILNDENPITRTGSTSEKCDSSRDQMPVATLISKVSTPTVASPICTTEHTYAFQEVRFARRLQRFCLEHAYRLFTDPGSDPTQIYRVFRLVACVKDPSKTQPRFKQLLMGGIEDSLELLGQPFYPIGGAGTHFPDFDQNGNPIYPVNSRMPRKVLGISPNAGLTPKASEDVLERYGLGGEWFDCHDVEGYLRLYGVDVNEGMFPRLHVPNGSPEGDDTGSFCLDIEGLFSRLLHDFVILGRAPGFKKTDIKRALQASVKRIDRRAPQGHFPTTLSKAGT